LTPVLFFMNCRMTVSEHKRGPAGSGEAAASLDPAALKEQQDPNLMRQFGAACAALELNDLPSAWFKLAITADLLDAESQQALYRLTHPTNGRPSRLTRQVLSPRWPLL
jgi:hypothetical protein